jgi:hypothetical protein
VGNVGAEVLSLQSVPPESECWGAGPKTGFQSEQLKNWETENLAF